MVGWKLELCPTIIGCLSLMSANTTQSQAMPVYIRGNSSGAAASVTWRGYSILEKYLVMQTDYSNKHHRQGTIGRVWSAKRVIYEQHGEDSEEPDWLTCTDPSAALPGGTAACACESINRALQSLIQKMSCLMPLVRD